MISKIILLKTVAFINHVDTYFGALTNISGLLFRRIHGAPTSHKTMVGENGAARNGHVQRMRHNARVPLGYK